MSKTKWRRPHSASHTDAVDARNAWLEWAVAHYITALPKVNRTGAINRITEISRN